MRLTADLPDVPGRLYRHPTTYIVLGLATFLLGFVFYLGGWEGVYGVFEWADEGDDAVFWLVAPSLGFYLGWILLLHGFHRYRLYNLIRNTPTTTVRAAPMGRVEIKGQVHPLSDDDLLRSPFREEPCVAYECEIEEYHEDDDGGHWETIHERREAPPFYLRDETGVLAVEAGDARWSFERDYRETYRETGRPEHLDRYVEAHVDESPLDVDPLGGEKQRFTEWYLAPGDDAYVLGGARPASGSGVTLPGGVDLLVRRDEATDTFFLSDGSEEEILRGQWWRGVLSLGGGVLLVPTCGAVLLELLAVT